MQQEQWIGCEPFAVCMMVITGGASAQTAKDLVGAWTIVSMTISGDTLTITNPTPSGGGGVLTVVLKRAGQKAM